MKKIIALTAIIVLSLALCIGVFADERYSIDGLYINNSVYNSGDYEFGIGQAGTLGEALNTEITITQGDKMYILGWFACTDSKVDRLVYRIDEETEYECQDNYRDRTEIYDYAYLFSWVEENGYEKEDFIKSGFGKDLEMMELTGIGNLPAGEYELEIVGKFTDGEEMVLHTYYLFVEERPLNIRDFNAETDKQYFDQILVNGEEKANGNEAVAALKALIDGSDGSVNTITMYGWFGWVDAETAFGDLLDSFGYVIDDGTPVFDKSFTFAETEQTVLDSNGMRYKTTVDVSGLDDGQTHVITGCVKLTNGDVVLFNRENREAIINYKAPEAPEEPTPEVIATEEPIDTTAEPDNPTEEPANATEAPNNGSEGTEIKNDGVKKGGGCGGIIGSAFALISSAACVLIIKKKH